MDGSGLGSCRLPVERAAWCVFHAGGSNGDGEQAMAWKEASRLLVDWEIHPQPVPVLALAEELLDQLPARWDNW